MILVMVLCGLSGIAGWAVWALILRKLVGQDWMVFYTAARAYFEGDLALVFDGERLTDAINLRYTAWHSIPLIFHPWLYPPHFLLLLLPFGLISFGASYVLFVILTFSANVAAVCRYTARHRLVIFGMFLFPQTPFAFLAGQNSFLTGSLLVGGIGFLEKRPLLGGALLGVATYKPQLFMLVPVALIASRQWKALASAAVTAAVLALASLALFGADIWQDWVQVMVAPSDTYQKWLVAGRLNGQSAYSCAVLAGASINVANAAQAVAALLGGVCVYWSFSKAIPTDLRLAVLLAAALLASPHVSSQDGIFLGIGAMLLFCRVIDGGGRFGEISVIVAAWVVELFDPPVIFGAGIVTPLVIALFIVVVMVRGRRTTMMPSTGAEVSAMVGA
jgi:alpha-1,2-mannosyltransferase